MQARSSWTGFANSEEDVADAYVGQQIQPFRIEDEATAMEGTNFIVQGAFRAHAVRDGNLVTHGLQSRASGAEHVAALLPGAHIVKAFSVYGFENLRQAPVGPAGMRLRTGSARD